jgi:hypothetical protein
MTGVFSMIDAKIGRASMKSDARRYVMRARLGTPSAKVICIVLLFWVTPSWSQTMALDTGNHLLEHCTGTDFQQTLCIGFLLGVVDGANTRIAVNPERGWICRPKTATHGQVRDVVVSYLKTNPATHRQAAGQVAFIALAEAYPCAR